MHLEQNISINGCRLPYYVYLNDEISGPNDDNYSPGIGKCVKLSC